jgi:hypothetical protein
VRSVEARSEHAHETARGRGTSEPPSGEASGPDDNGPQAFSTQDASSEQSTLEASPLEGAPETSCSQRPGRHEHAPQARSAVRDEADPQTHPREECQTTCTRDVSPRLVDVDPLLGMLPTLARAPIARLFFDSEDGDPAAQMRRFAPDVDEMPAERNRAAQGEDPRPDPLPSSPRGGQRSRMGG